ncbi:TerD family protein [Streptomyces apocyni]|uniref:TerD family protein n=1 Tax=Streptomyces apocyni TaxID=2654677 RepID=UPI0012EAAD24|nr:TerD family protein [Streptomyces apocyni]
MSGLSVGQGKIEVGLKWDPSAAGTPAHHLDIVAATYRADDPADRPGYLVHLDSRSPDGTINLARTSRTGQGLGYDEVMTLELNRLASAYTLVVVGVVIQQHRPEKTFGDVANVGVRVREAYHELLLRDFTDLASASSATVAKFTRTGSGGWEFHEIFRGFDADPVAFARLMGGV